MNLRGLLPRGLSLPRIVATLSMTLIPLGVAYAQSKCPGQCCGTAVNCGGSQGPLGLCSKSQAGGACNGCDGTTNVRICADCVQTRSCKPITGAATNCGKPFTGTCTQSTFGYWYCDNTAAGTNSCTVTGECTGDKACP